MRSFFSIALVPGKVGTHFYNGFFKELRIDAVYTALAATNLGQVVPRLRQAQVAGFSVSMPFKAEIMPLLSSADQISQTTHSCNTVRVEHGEWVGYNTDYNGALWCAQRLPKEGSVKILGNGAMSRVFQKVLLDEGFRFKVYARSLGNWHEREEPHLNVINATPVGTLDDSSPLGELAGTSHVVDLSMKKGLLAKLCEEKRVSYLSGFSFYKIVFLRQFEIYTGVTPDPTFFDYLARKIEP